MKSKLKMVLTRIFSAEAFADRKAAEGRRSPGAAAFDDASNCASPECTSPEILKIRCFDCMLLIMAAGLGVFAADNSSQPDATNAVAASSEKTLYTCGMHPWIIQDHPGDCPICGMKLEPVRQNGGGRRRRSSSAIAIDPATIQLMNIQTTEIARGPLRRTIRTVGTIDFNETALADVTTKFKGWIEKLDVDATGQLVHRGEPLFEIYSPELYSAEAEYLA